MPSYVAWIPINATAKFVFESEKELSGQELIDAMIENGQPEGSLCHQCVRDLDAGYFEMDEAWANKNLTAEDISEVE